jgi:two-component system sensor histidine kinase/response regulator
MNGRVWLESEVGKGTTFHFTARFARSEGIGAAPDDPLPAMRGLRALVADDNPRARRAVAAMLAHWGLRPVEAEDGEAAFEALEAAAEAGDPFAIALVDADMRDLERLAVAGGARRRAGLVGATIMMLPAARRLDDARWRALDATAEVRKPVMEGALLEALRVAVGTAEAVEPALRSGDTPSAPSRSLRILVADDDLLNQTLVRRLLEKRGHSAVVVDNGRKAIAAVEAEPFDCVLLDVQMPEMDGLDVIAAIRTRERTTGGRLPIVMLTAHAMGGYRERCLTAGADGYVSKPIDSALLFATVEGLAAGRTAPTAPVADAGLPEPMLDEAELLARVAGDVELVQQLVDLFLADCPKLLAEVRGALARGDSTAVARAAHTLAGSAGSISAKAAFEAALELERSGRGGDLARAREACAALVREVERLRPHLAAFGA